MSKEEKQKKLNQDDLKKLLDYDESTGKFYWKVRSANNVFPGDEAGVSSGGYVCITINRSLYKAHRLAWLYVNGKWPDLHIDHINGIKNDNRISNLRDVCSRVNSENLNKATKANKSGFLGVTISRKKFLAMIKKDGVTIYLGTFDKPEDAHAAYLKEKAKLHEGAYLCRILTPNAS